MSTAARVAAFQQRWGGSFVAPSQAGPAAGGGAFLSELFGGNARQRVLMAFGADLTADPDTWSWTDVTTCFLWEAGINTTIGRPPESTRITPATMTGVIRNDQPGGGDWTVGNALSPRWPNVKENTPVLADLDVGSGPSIRFQGYAVSFKPDTFTVNDDGDRIAVVRFKAAGIARQMLQGKQRAKSPLRRLFEESSPAPVAYWHLEDPAGSAFAASGLPGGAPMTAAGGSSGASAVSFGASQGRLQAEFTGFEVPRVATDSFVSLGEGGSLSAPLPGPVVGATTWTVSFIAYSWAYTGIAGSNLVLARWFTPGGTFARWDVVQSSLTGGIELIAYTAGGAATTLCATTFAPVDEYAYMIIVTQNGANIDTTLWVARVITAGLIGEVDTDSRAGTLAFPSAITLNPARTAATGTGPADNQAADIRFGHLGVWHELGPYMFGVATSPDTGRVYGPWTGWIGEGAAERLRRLARKAGVPINIIGSSDAPMGRQPSGKTLDLMAEPEAVDGGLLLDGLGPGLTYVCRSHAYSRTADLTLDLAEGQVQQPLRTEHDDLGRVNAFTASNPDGGERVFEKTTGDLGTADVGLYEDGGFFRTADESALYDIAAWRVSLGTVTGLRYPGAGFELAKEGTTQIAQQWLDTRPLGRIDALGLRRGTADPDGSFLLRAWSERWNSRQWSATTSLAPYDPWRIATVAAESSDSGEFLWRATGGYSSLSADAEPGATSLTVATSAGPVWTTDVDHVAGLVIEAGGLRIPVTAITGATSPQTFTVDGSAVLKALPAGTSVDVWQPPGIGM
jgi:hypothetical protein